MMLIVASPKTPRFAPLAPPFPARLLRTPYPDTRGFEFRERNHRQMLTTTSRKHSHCVQRARGRIYSS